MTIAYSVYVFVYSIAFASSYFFLLDVLYQSFRGSEFAITRRYIVIHIVLAFTILFCCGNALFFVYVTPHWSGGYLIFVTVVLYLIGIAHMVYTLNMKLIKMILLATTKSKLNVFGEGIQAKFLQTVTKLSVLQGLFVICATLFVVVSILHNAVFPLNYVSYLLDWAFFILTMMVDTLCMYLTFTMNASEYRTLCKLCNRCCSRGCHLLVLHYYSSEIMMTEVNTIRRNTMSACSVPTNTMSFTPTNTRMVTMPSTSSNAAESETSSRHEVQTKLGINFDTLDVIDETNMETEEVSEVEIAADREFGEDLDPQLPDSLPDLTPRNSLDLHIDVN
eukprot:CAMPEP_0197075108 /NCGR_PEP_ID=MMETSP1384-20130603/211446_1 /TAXON_ID=29189 /ORGANISM="Ammonia sp." /LENGTH=333 /DNA_ID=CAMNT_0042513951 /DNA_START=287 /DNA_END=1288 /DNA_ORIENTATION=-